MFANLLSEEKDSGGGGGEVTSGTPSPRSRPGMDPQEEKEAFETHLRTTTDDLEKLKGKTHVQLLKKRLLILLKLKKYKEVIDEGRRLIGKRGHDTIFYKAIISAQCGIGKFDQSRETLEKWSRATPNSPAIDEVREKLEVILNPVNLKVKSGGKQVGNLDETLGLHVEWANLISEDYNEGKWRFRPPPKQQLTFSLCSRNPDCLFGISCRFAHSKEELAEWEERSGRLQLPNNGNKNKSGKRSGNKTPRPGPSSEVLSSSPNPHGPTNTNPKSQKFYNYNNNNRFYQTPPRFAANNNNPNNHWNSATSNFHVSLSSDPSLMPLQSQESPMTLLNTLSMRITDIQSKTYLEDIRKRIELSGDISRILAHEVENVVIRTTKPLEVNTTTEHISWTFIISSPKALRKACLLQDKNRGHFYISAGSFHSPNGSSLNLIPIHPGNQETQLQVLNTFIPSAVFYHFFERGSTQHGFNYTIEINFQLLRTPEESHLLDLTTFDQILLLDFNQDPKLIKCIRVQLLPMEFGNVFKPLGTEDLAQVPPLELEGGEPFRGSSGFNEPEKFMDDPKTNVSKVPQDKVNSKIQMEWATREPPPVKLSSGNYVELMDQIIQTEICYRQLELWKLTRIVDLTFSTSYLEENGNDNEIRFSPVGYFYTSLETGSSLSEDTPLGYLFHKFCAQVILTSQFLPGKSYLVRIQRKEDARAILLIDPFMIRELSLNLKESHKFKLDFKLEAPMFDGMRKALSQVGPTELEFLFPYMGREVKFQIQEYDGVQTFNRSQKAAFDAITKHAIGNESIPPILVIGPFGTGKTFTLFQSVKTILLSQENSRVLICTHSNSAANLYTTILHEWLQYQETPIPFIRLFYKNRQVDTVHQKIRKYGVLSSDLTKFRYPRKEELLGYRVIVATLGTSYQIVNAGIQKGTFTHIMIDEAAQALEQETISPLLLADSNTRIVLAGDPMQLSPKLYSANSEVTINYLERLSSMYPQGHPCKIILTENYGTHEDILKFVSTQFYGSSVSCATIQPRLSYPHPLSFFAVYGKEVQGNSGFFNKEEIVQLSSEIKRLTSAWPSKWGNLYDPNSIAVITPYMEQVTRIRAHFRLLGLGFVTVDRILNTQGRQFRVVLITTVRTLKGSLVPTEEMDDAETEAATDLGFLSNPRLINTTISRARSLVMVFGDPISLCGTGKCRDIWDAYIREATTHFSFHGEKYENLRRIVKGQEFNKDLSIPNPPHSLPPRNKSWTGLEVIGPSSPFSPQEEDYVKSILGTNSNLAEAFSNMDLDGNYDWFPKLNSPIVTKDEIKFFNSNNNSSSSNTSQYLLGSGSGSGGHSLLRVNTPKTTLGQISPQVPRLKSLANQSNFGSSPNLVMDRTIMRPSNVPPPGFGFHRHPFQGIMIDGIPGPSRIPLVSRPDPGVIGSPPRSKVPVMNQMPQQLLATPTHSPNSSVSTQGPSYYAFPNRTTRNFKSVPSTFTDESPGSSQNQVQKNPRSFKTKTQVSPMKPKDFPPLALQGKGDNGRKSVDEGWVEVKTKKIPKKGTPPGGPSPKSEMTAEEKITILMNEGFDKKTTIKALQKTNKDLSLALNLLLASPRSKVTRVTPYEASEN